ncbi:phosphohistidine phosphatase SixA [Alteromonas sp. ASW11-130]|uniref:phosphohistidine phosphatase SixA n=1 Tax=Alteromonas sp. ASW11-130 TaxID=3015775 RepID=UPI002242AC07|nr:phosphohistidine phosphatase SixA [Alteromonas sp. ASW11-130]MCW8093040.1 phosphohistidine phosphatase SixA [Alteromonas sp. ASW11-130]
MSGQSSNDDILLFVMRHGEAESLRVDDKSRQLTPEGRVQAMNAAKWLIKHYLSDGQVDLALVSPYRRARQTYDMLSLDIRPFNMEICHDIIPDGDAEMTHDFLDVRMQDSQSTVSPLKSILLVSHMPLVSYLVDSLCCSHTTSLFATASVAVIRYSIEKRCGVLEEHYQGY